jgi:hypothetical protein
MTQLIVFVEGSSDEAFVNNIILENFPSYFLTFYQYSTKPRTKVKKYISSILRIIESQENTKFLIFVDKDSNHYSFDSIPDDETVKDKFIQKYSISSILNNEDLQSIREIIHVVICEIESWYLAGMEDKGRFNGLDPDSICKEQFEHEFIENRFKNVSNRSELNSFIISNFSLGLALESSNSLSRAYDQISNYLQNNLDVNN